MHVIVAAAMKRVLSYLIFLAVLIGVVTFAYQALSGEEEASETSSTSTETIETAPPAEKPKVFASDRLGLSFMYPGSWSMPPVEGYDSLFLGVDGACTKNCQGFMLVAVRKENFDTKGAYSSFEDYIKNVIPDGKGEDKGILLVSITPQEESAKSGISRLEIFNKKDTLYSFEAIPPALGSIFNQIVDSFQEIPRVTLAAEPPTDIREFKFDSCGNLDTYQSQTFYADLVQKFETIQRYNQPSSVLVGGVTKLMKENVTDTCYSQAGNIVVMLVSGQQGQCDAGQIVKYETDTGRIEAADFSPAANVFGKCAGLVRFGKREGRFIPTKAAYTNEMTAQNLEWDLLYDYIDNKIYPKRECEKKVNPSDASAPPTVECKDLS